MEHFMKKFTFFSFLVLTLSVFANPKGESVVHGEACFSRDENSLVVTQKSEKSIINWEDFSIGKGELTRFIQPSNGSSLNRVISENPSLIYGNLQANGRVYLINKTGILVGESAVIDTKSFLASTLDVKNSEFLSGENLNFFGDSDALFENEGILKSFGDITIIAKEINNKGSLTSKEGDVNLIATTEIFLKGKEIVIKPDCKGYLSNSGKIKAISAKLKSSGNFNELAINQEGIIEADSLIEEGGEILLKSEKGEVRVTGTLKASKKGDGGTIHVLGEHVSLCGDAVLDVSSDFNAGTILVGGDYKGENENIENSKSVFVGSNVNVFADSKIDGNGGKVIFWGDDRNHFFGTVSAMGGVEKGDGGFVEVSSKLDWIYKGKVTTLALNGKSGMLLLDPSDIEISTSASAPGYIGNPIYPDYNPPQIGFPEVFPCNLNAGEVALALGSSDVTISTSNGSLGSGDVTFKNGSAISWSSANKLIIDANRNITIESGAVIINDNAGNPTVLDFEAITGTFSVGENINIGTSRLYFQFNTSFTLASGKAITCGANSVIRGGTGDATFNMNGGATSVNFELDGQTTGNNLLIYGVGGAATWDITTGTLKGNLVGGYSFVNIDEIQGSNSGDDLFRVYDGAVVPTLDGRVGVNTLDASNVTSAVIWTVNGVNSGQLELTTPSTSTFSNIHNLTGTPSDVDTFNLTSGSINNVSSGGGSNVYNMNGTNVNTIVGGTGADSFNVNAGTMGTIDGNAGANVFTITGGIVTTMSGGTGNDTFDINGGTVTNINGGLGNDTFNMNAGSVVTINGNAGTNVYNLDGGTIANLNGGTGNDTFYLNDFSVVTVQIDGNTGTDNLFAQNTTNTWNITGANAGDVTAAATTVNFINIENLFGSVANNDTFNVNNSINSIDGEGGNNIYNLDYATSAVTTITGGPGIDTFNISDGSVGTINGVSGSNVFNISGGTITNANGGTGNDTFNMNVGTGAVTNMDGVDGVNNFYLNGGIVTTLTGGTSSDNFYLIVGGTAITNPIDGNTGTNSLFGPNSVNTWNITGAANAGNVAGVNFISIGDLYGNTNNDTFNIDNSIDLVDGGAGNNIYNLDFATSAAGIITGGTGIDTFNISDGTVTTINGTAGANVFNISGGSITNANGGTGNDTFNMDVGTGAVTNMDGVSGANVYNLDGGTVANLTGGTAQDTFYLNDLSVITTAMSGGLGTNTLVGPNAVNTWNITDNNVVNINSVTPDFTNINYLTGNAGNDEFIFSDIRGIAGTIDGGAGGTNTLDYSDYTSAVSIDLQNSSATKINSGLPGGFSNIDTFVGGATIFDNMTAPNADNTWNLTSNNAGDVGGFNFSSFENLTGQTLNDDFVFSAGVSISGTIDGVAGDNSFDYSAPYGSQVTVNLQTSTATGTGGFANIGTFIGGNHADDVIIGPNAAVSWNITDTNAGNIPGIVTFSQFKNVTGGTSEDSFVFADGISIAGVVNGGSGAVNDIDFTSWIANPISADLPADYSNIQRVKVIAEVDGGVVVGDGLTILEGHPTSGTWNITGGNQGTYGDIGKIVNFSGIATLEGSASIDDKFSFNAGGSVDGFIIGGGGSLNELDYSGFGAPIYVNLETGVATGTGGFTQIQKVTGGGTAGDTLVATNTNNTWQITDNNAGNINSGAIIFSGIEYLTGGSLNDIFVFTDQMGVSGIIDGGSVSPYINTLDYSNYTTPVHVDLDLGEATGTGGITRIQNFILPSSYPIVLMDLIRLYVTEISLASDLRDDNKTYYYYSWPIRIWKIEDSFHKLTPTYFYEFFRKEIKDKNLLMR
jgi:filamentous hemagglutinin family protein